MEDLDGARELYIRQVPRFFRNKRYAVETSIGKHFLTIQEDTHFIWHLIATSSRPFSMFIKDLKGEILFLIMRPFNIRNYCLPCCSKQEVWITDGTGRDIGTIEQEYSCPNPHFLVKNDRGAVRLTIEAPPCPYTFYCCRRAVNFAVSNRIQDLYKVFKRLTRAQAWTWV